ncbi:MAG: hypothetical protein ACOZAM_22320 [Pseudomonadota bacterium]
MTIDRNGAISLVSQICGLAGSKDYLRTLRRQARRNGLAEAIEARDTPTLFGHLMWSFSYQGISDNIADAYIEAHGNATWNELAELMVGKPGRCSLLLSFETYRGCGFRKTHNSCSHPKLLSGCPVPIPPLRKGDLNQLAISLYLFLRDECRHDLVGYIDRIVCPGTTPQEARLNLIRAFSQIHAVSSKLTNMALSDLLLLGGRKRKSWKAVGLEMIAIDSLVHNFLHRTGTLTAFQAQHGYGSGCYGPNGCAEVVREISRQIDCRQFNPRYPACFPRFVQHAIWSFCTEREMDVCNGRNIDDRFPCSKVDCPVGGSCARLPLKIANQTTRVARRGRPRKGLGRLPKPYKQGELDGLCGVYAVVNALRLSLRHLGRFKPHVFSNVFEELVAEIDRLQGYGNASVNGITTPRITQLLKLAIEFIEADFDLRLEVARPLLNRKQYSMRQAIKCLRRELERPGTSLLLGLDGEYGHWTVAHRITQTSILLHDSAGYRRVAIRACRLRHETRQSAKRLHVIGAGSAFIVRATAQ